MSGWVTCNIDAAVFKKINTLVRMVALYGMRTGFFYCFSGQFMRIVDPKFAEARAFREALTWLKGLSVPKVLIELDSLGVVQAFRHKDKDTSYFGAFMPDCQFIVKYLRSYSVYFDRHTVSSAAHTIL